MNLSTTTTEILRNAAAKTAPKGDPRKAVMVRFEPELWAKAIKKKNRMSDEAADNGIFENIPIHTVVIKALEAFCSE
jgi:hypothetical protein